MKYAHTACLGGGVIGASWAALFLASGRSVTVYDPDPDIERHVKSYIERAWPTLTLGLTTMGRLMPCPLPQRRQQRLRGQDGSGKRA